MAEVSFKYKNLVFTPKAIELNYNLIRIIHQIHIKIEKEKLIATKDMDLSKMLEYETKLLELKTIIDSFKDKVKSKQEIKKFTDRLKALTEQMAKDMEYLLVATAYNEVCRASFNSVMYDEGVIKLIPQLVNEPMNEVKIPSKEALKLLTEITEFFFQFIKS